MKMILDETEICVFASLRCFHSARSYLNDINDSYRALVIEGAVGAVAPTDF